MTRTVARADLRVPDGDVYVVRAMRVLWPRDAPVADSVIDAIDLLGPDIGPPWDTLHLLPVRVRWGVRVYRKTRRPRPWELVYGEGSKTAADSVTRALEVARVLAGAD